MKKLIILIFCLLVITIPVFSAEKPLKINLNKCIENALETDISLKEAQKEVAISEGQLKQVRSGLYPSLSLGATFSRQNEVPVINFPGTRGGLPIYDENQHNVTFSLKYLISDGHGIASLNSQAEASLEGYKINAEKIKQDVIYKSAFAYLNTLKAKNLARVAEEYVNLSKEQLSLAKSRFDAGTAAKADVLKAEASLAESEIKLVDAKNGLNISLSTLNNVMGLSLGTSLEFDEEFVYKEWNITFEESLAKALQERLEIYIVEKTKESLYYGKEFAKSSWYPQIFFKLDYTPYANSLITDNNTLVATLGTQFSIFDGFKTAGAVDEAEAKYEKMSLQEDDVKKNINLDVKRSYLTFQSFSEKVIKVEKNLEAAKESYRVYQISYREGISPFIDVNQAQLTLINAEVNKVNAIYEYYVARLELLRAMGILGKWGETLNWNTQ